MHSAVDESECERSLLVGRGPATVVPHDGSLRVRWNLDAETARRHLQRAGAAVGLPIAPANFGYQLRRRGARLLVRGRQSLPVQRLHGGNDVSDVPADRSPTVGLLGAGFGMSRPDTASRLDLRLTRGFVRTRLQSTDRLRERRLAVAQRRLPTVRGTRYAHRHAARRSPDCVAACRRSRLQRGPRWDRRRPNRCH